MRARAWGIDETYLDFRGVHHRVPPATIRSLLEAMGADGPQPPPNPVLVAQEGEDVVLDGHFELLTEDGASETIGNRLPTDLRAGYHNLVDIERDETKRLIVAPARCYLPSRLKTWGWMIQLYALRAQAGWGIGDLSVLRRFNEWAAATGAGMTMINPLHSVEPQLDEASPYFPGSRLWRNPMYIDVEDVPGAASAADELEGLGGQGRALNDERVIRRDAVRKLKLAALDLLWDRWPGDPAFDEFCRRGGDALEKFATFAVLAEAHGDDWRRWPTPLRRPENGAVVREARARRRVDFNKWLQWLLDRQLARASKSIALVGDLAIGVNPRGFDAWLWQDVFASHVSVGAPPDDFNLEGQDWSLASFDPWRLRAAGYEPFIAMLRSAFRHMGGLRYDHVMGLWRLFWIPHGATTPAAGAYVRYPAGDLLAILALESARAGAFVIGEDLGTVEEGVREEMARRDLLSYRLLCFEQSDPPAYPARALAAVTNHDLPTLPGLWRRGGGSETGSGPAPNEAFEEVVRERVRRITGLDASADVADAVAATYRALAGAPSRLVAATLEDALGVSEQPNRPGSTGEVPNWSLALPASLEQILEDPGPRRLARILRRREG